MFVMSASMGETTRVCVTGGSGYIGSWIVKRLLERGYTVHATVRNSGKILISFHFDSFSAHYLCVLNKGGFVGNTGECR